MSIKLSMFTLSSCLTRSRYLFWCRRQCTANRRFNRPIWPFFFITLAQYSISPKRRTVISRIPTTNSPFIATITGWSDGTKKIIWASNTLKTVYLKKISVSWTRMYSKPATADRWNVPNDLEFGNRSNVGESVPLMEVFVLV